jgi:hypothetical protein
MMAAAAAAKGNLFMVRMAGTAPDINMAHSQQSVTGSSPNMTNTERRGSEPQNRILL